MPLDQGYKFVLLRGTLVDARWTLSVAYSTTVWPPSWTNACMVARSSVNTYSISADVCRNVKTSVCIPRFSVVQNIKKNNVVFLANGVNGAGGHPFFNEPNVNGLRAPDNREYMADPSGDVQPSRRYKRSTHKSGTNRDVEFIGYHEVCNIRLYSFIFFCIPGRATNHLPVGYCCRVLYAA